MATTVGSELFIAVHGLQVRVHGDWPEVLEAVRLDFAAFDQRPSPDTPDVDVEVRRVAPRPQRFRSVAASFVTPRNVVYQVDGVSVIDYRGRALAAYDRGAGRMVIEGLEGPLVQEAAYQFLLSRIGTHLDAVGRPRLHALALSGDRGAVAVLLPSGGGKSTLALRALEDDGVKLISEDTPLLGPRGRLHPFVLRMGINADDGAAAARGALRPLERMEFHPKYAVEVAAFADRLEQEPQPLRDLVVGVRTLGERGALERVGRRAAVGPLLREGVVGVGVYQGMEFVLQRGMRDTLGQLGVAAVRSQRCAVALARARVWRLRLGRDLESNWTALRPLLAGTGPT